MDSFHYEKRSGGNIEAHLKKKAKFEEPDEKIEADDCENVSLYRFKVKIVEIYLQTEIGTEIKWINNKFPVPPPLPTSRASRHDLLLPSSQRSNESQSEPAPFGDRVKEQVLPALRDNAWRELQLIFIFKIINSKYRVSSTFEHSTFQQTTFLHGREVPTGRIIEFYDCDEDYDDFEENENVLVVPYDCINRIASRSSTEVFDVTVSQGCSLGIGIPVKKFNTDTLFSMQTLSLARYFLSLTVWCESGR